MPGSGDRPDFFVSRRGSVAAVAHDTTRGFQNANERFAYPNAAAIAGLQQALATAVAHRLTVLPTGVFEQTWAAIKLIQRDKKSPRTAG